MWYWDHTTHLLTSSGNIKKLPKKKKKKFKCEVSAYANLTYCIILVTAATKVTDSDFSLSLSFEEHLLRYCVPMVSAP